MGGINSTRNLPHSNLTVNEQLKTTNLPEDWVRLNVGGKVFQTTKDTLSRYPESFLACLVNGNLPSETDESGAYLIDRSYEHFDTILNYFRSNVLNLDHNEKAVKDLLCEADYYNIQPLVELLEEKLKLLAKDELFNKRSQFVLSQDTMSLAVDPPAVHLPASGGVSIHTLNNPGKSRLAFKVKSTNYSHYRVRPVFGFIEPRQSAVIEFTRLVGPPRKDKLLIQYIEVGAYVTDATDLFKTCVPRKVMLPTSAQ